MCSGLGNVSLRECIASRMCECANVQMCKCDMHGFANVHPYMGATFETSRSTRLSSEELRAQAHGAKSSDFAWAAFPPSMEATFKTSRSTRHQCMLRFVSSKIKHSKPIKQAAPLRLVAMNFQNERLRLFRRLRGVACFVCFERFVFSSILFFAVLCAAKRSQETSPHALRPRLSFY